jgi:hypothetical protein
MEKDYVKIIFVDNLIITVLVIFVIVYIWHNWNVINSNEYYLNGNFSNPILITAIITVLSLLIIGDKYENVKQPLLGGIDNQPLPVEVNRPIIPNIPNDVSNVNPKPKVGGLPTYKIAENDIFIPYSKKDMYMDVNV